MPTPIYARRNQLTRVSSLQIACWYRGFVGGADGLTVPVSYFDRWLEGQDPADIEAGAGPQLDAEVAVAELIHQYTTTTAASGDHTPSRPGLGFPPEWAFDMLCNVGADAPEVGEVPPRFGGLSWTGLKEYLIIHNSQLRIMNRLVLRNIRHCVWHYLAVLTQSEEFIALVNTQQPLFNANEGGDPLQGVGQPARGGAFTRLLAVDTYLSDLNRAVSANAIWLRMDDNHERPGSVRHAVVHGLPEGGEEQLTRSIEGWIPSRRSNAELFDARVRDIGGAVTTLSWSRWSVLHDSVLERDRLAALPYDERVPTTRDTVLVTLENPDPAMQSDLCVVEGLESHELDALQRRYMRSREGWSDTDAVAAAVSEFRTTVDRFGGRIVAVTREEYRRIRARVRELVSEERSSEAARQQVATGQDIPERFLESPLTNRSDGPNIDLSNERQPTAHTMPNEHTPFLPVLPRRVGVELEAKGISTRAAHAALRTAGMDANHEGHTHLPSSTTTEGPWRVVRDGSLSGEAFEAVSPPTTSTYEVWRACRVLRQAGARVDRQCGTHVHVDATNFEVADFKNAAKIWLRFEGALDGLLPASRRTRGTYCHSNLSHVATVRNGITHAFEQIDNAGTMEEVKNIVQSGRFFKFNMESYWRHRTIEFRSHAGTLNGAKLSRWITICVGIMEAAQQGVSVEAGVGTLEELMLLVRNALPSIFEETLDVEHAEPTSHTETVEVERWVRTDYTPRTGTSSEEIVRWLDIVWQGSGSPQDIPAELRRQMGVVARECANASAATVRVIYLRWMRARIGQSVTETQTNTVETPAPVATSTLDSETYRSWFVSHIEARVAVLA